VGAARLKCIILFPCHELHPILPSHRVPYLPYWVLVFLGAIRPKHCFFVFLDPKLSILKILCYEKSIYLISELVRYDVGKHGSEGPGSKNPIDARMELDIVSIS
jgi:hypothetical protein